MNDPEAFSRLVETHQQRLFALCLMMTRDRPGAEEAAQDAFILAYRNLDRYDPSRPFYPWLATIAVRQAQTWLRRRARVASREGAELPAVDPAASAADPLAELITDERDRRLWRLVSDLPSSERAAVLLHYRQQLKVTEVAEALGVTSGTIKTLLFRARKRLRQSLEPQEKP